MDLLDRRLLYELDLNSSLRYAELGRRLKVQSELVRYRLLRLERDGIIGQTTSSLDLHGLGLMSFQVLFRLQNVSETRIEDISRTLMNFPNVSWLARVEGAYHLEVIIRVPEPNGLTTFLEAVNDLFGEVIANRTLMANVGQQHLPRDYLKGRKRRSYRPKRASAQFGTLHLDEIDRSILRILQQCARTGRVELARTLLERSEGRISLTPEGVAHRQRSLEERGVIHEYLLSLNNGKMDQMVYRVLYAFSRMTPAKQSDFLKRCFSEPRCVFYTRTLGEWDIELEFEVTSPSELRAILARITTPDSAEIKDYCILERRELLRFNLVF